MINILYLHTGAELYGADIVLLTLLQNIDREKYNPIVVLPSDGPLVRELKKINIEVCVVDYPILRRQFFSPKGIVKYFFEYFIKSREVLRVLNNKRIDIIHVNTIAVLEGIYISRKLKKPLLWHVHEILDKPKIIFKITSALLGMFATKVITVSKAVKEHLLSSGFIKENKIKVIYNGIDNKIFNWENKTEGLKTELNIPGDSFVLGMIGRVNAIKGQEDFIKIAESLIKKYENVFAVVVGDAFPGQEWRVEELIKRIENSECKNNIRYLGYRTDAPNLHCLFDVYLLPSIRPDSLPTVVLEAMASKRVVAGYKNGGIVEMVVDRETGYIEEIGDVDSVSRDIEEVYFNRKLYENMAQKGYERQKEKFSISCFIGNVEKVYESVYSENGDI